MKKVLLVIDLIRLFNRRRFITSKYNERRNAMIVKKITLIVMHY